MRQIFNFQKAYFILDELLLAGEMQESSKKNVLRVISAQDSIEDTEVSWSQRFGFHEARSYSLETLASLLDWQMLPLHQVDEEVTKIMWNDPFVHLCSTYWSLAFGLAIMNQTQYLFYYVMVPANLTLYSYSRPPKDS